MGLWEPNELLGLNSRSGQNQPFEPIGSIYLPSGSNYKKSNNNEMSQPTSRKNLLMPSMSSELPSSELPSAVEATTENEFRVFRLPVFSILKAGSIGIFIGAFLILLYLFGHTYSKKTFEQRDKNRTRKRKKRKQ